MGTVEKTITINAPVEKVFGYIDERANLPEVWPSLVEVEEVERLSNGGACFQFVYKMAGMRFKGRSEDTEYVANQRVVSKTTGGIDSTVTWTYQPEGGGTKLTIKAEYSVPAPLVGKLAEAFIVKVNEHEGESLLANVKARMEA